MHPIIEAIFEGQNPQSIFEVGCAQGKLWKEYYDDRTRLGPGKDDRFDRTKLVVGGLDIDKRNIPGAKELYPDYADNFLLWGAHEVPWPIKDKQYDLVFTVGTLLLIKDPLPVIKEMIRIGKKVILAEFHDPTLTEDRITSADGQNESYHIRIYRNYEKILETLGIKPTITQVHDKWVIKL